MITENIDTLKIQKLSEEQIKREMAAGNLDPNSIYATPEKEVELATRLSEVDKADWVDDGVPQWWIDTEITAEEFSRLTGGKYSFTKSKGSGYAYDFGYEFIRIYIEHSRGRGQYNKYALTVGPNPVPDPDFKDWDIVRDESGAIISMAPLRFNDSVPMRLGEAGHLRGPAELSAYEALTGSARLMALLSYGAASEKFATIEQQKAISAELEEHISQSEDNFNDHITTHNSNSEAHADIRTLLSELTTRLNTVANSDDVTLDQLKEIVAYIKNNKALIDSVTTSKVSVADIVDNLTSTSSTKPLSAYQGYKLKSLIPTALSQLNQSASYRTVTDTEKATWNSKMGVGTSQFLNVNNEMGAGLWYIELVGTVSFTGVEVRSPIGIVQVDGNNKSIYCSTFDRDFVIYNGGYSWNITTHNSYTSNFGNVTKVIATKLA
ncbi:MAG: hypothetical protein IKJ13_07570 [Clostridia bacterium]|nr:hypothetical protein [Clostridia bacterium]